MKPLALPRYTVKSLVPASSLRSAAEKSRMPSPLMSCSTPVRTTASLVTRQTGPGSE
ncbi:hypothetical protein D9M68_623130 [compost metagenome]